MGVEGVQVLKTPDPSIFDNLEDEGLASHLAGLYERLSGDPGGPFTLYFFTESVDGIVFDAGVVKCVGADHAVKAHGCPKRAFVCRICED